MEPLALPKRFNAEKHAIAPWWKENSKEAYPTGIADLCIALKNFSDSKTAKGKGKVAGFPKFKSRHKDHARVRFSTALMRLEPERRTITLPVLGALRSKESTRRLERLVRAGRARILNTTLSERWGRWFVSFSCIVEAHPYPAPTKGGRAGVEPGLRVLASVAETPAPSPKSPTPPLSLRRSTAAPERTPTDQAHPRAKRTGCGESQARIARPWRAHRREQATRQLTTMLADT